MIASLALPLLRRLDPERAHDLALAGLRLGLAGAERRPDPTPLAVSAAGLAFRNPLGLAAGFDKNAVAIAPLMALGFGFVECGTVTPRPQAGNPRPRLFRLEQDRAVVNRMGFNNDGLEALLPRIARKPRPAPLGVNVGINKAGADPVRDYPALVRAVSPHADYIVVNVSSPNTPGLRDLQGETQLRALLGAIAAEARPHPPLFVKLAPDLADAALAGVVELCVEVGAAGLIISNTTVARPKELRSAAAREAGGLSGPPLFARSTAMLARAHGLAGKRLTLIGCGGVRSGCDAMAKILAGASLVQVYTAFAYEGPGLVRRIKAELAQELAAAGFDSVQHAVGAEAARRG